MGFSDVLSYISSDPQPKGSEKHPDLGSPWCNFCTAEALDSHPAHVAAITSLFLHAVGAQAQTCVKSCLLISLPQHSFDSQPDLSLGGGETRDRRSGKEQKGGVPVTRIS